MHNGVAARRKLHPRANRCGQQIAKIRVDLLQCCIGGPADGARAEGSDGLVNGNDSPDFGGVLSFAAQQFKLRIDHFDAGGPQTIDFGFSVKHEQLSWLQPAFKVAAMEKFARQRAGVILHEQVIDRIAAPHAAYGLSARHAHAQGKDTVWPNVLDLRKMDAIFIAKGKIAEQVFQRVNAALFEQLRALRAHTFNHSNVGL